MQLISHLGFFFHVVIGTDISIPTYSAISATLADISRK